jgi:hypothetical protein
LGWYAGGTDYGCCCVMIPFTVNTFLTTLRPPGTVCHARPAGWFGDSHRLNAWLIPRWGVAGASLVCPGKQCRPCFIFHPALFSPECYPELQLPGTVRGRQRPRPCPFRNSV